MRVHSEETIYKYQFLIIASLLYLSCTSEQNKNFEDLKSINQGMKLEEVLKHMRNEPIRSEPAYWSDSLFIYSYASPAAASDHYKIVFNKKDSTVVELMLGD